MPFPEDLLTCHVFGTFYDSTGVPDEGIITLTQTPPALVVGDPSYAIDQRPIELELDAAGVVARDITATDNSGVGPTGWTYRVDYALRSRSQTLYTFAPAGTNVDLVKIAGTEPVDLTATRVLTVGGVHPGPDGDVPVESIPGSPGPPGRGVTGATIVSGHLIVSYSDSTQQDVGQVVGANGTNGTNGADGADGADGNDGAPGRGITGTSIVGGHLIVSYSDSTQQDVGQVVGANGADGARIRVVSAYIKTGDVTFPDSGGGWKYPGDSGGLASGFEIQIPATVGDYIDIDADAMINGNTTAYVDFAIKMGTGPFTYPWHASSGGNTPAAEGMPGWYQAGFRTRSAARGLYVDSSHISAGGVVRFVLANKSAGSGTLFASNSYPFWWRVRNLGPVPA